MNASADAAGFSWIRWIFLFAEAVTAAAVFRAGARIFLGWGPVDTHDSAPKHEEKPETKQRHEHTAPTMFIPATVLVVAGLLLGLMPNLESSAVMAAAQFENTNAYAAHVLASRPMPPASVTPHIPVEILTGLLTISAAVALAAIHLFSPRSRKLWATLAIPLRLLHRLHSGHIGDYVAFLTFGMACFGLLCAYCFR